MTDATARYSAFISYARHDEVAARWLQRRLETYHLPRRLRSNGSARLLPVFRDRDELSAAADLDAALKLALAESAWLIVVCTPAAAASRWVTREIELFRDLHGSDRILTALFDGEAAHAFAPALRGPDGSAPLAADFRPGGDGRRLGSLKLIARLAGVRLDDLVHRDATRRARRFGFAALAAMLLALGMGALALVAVRAQRAAEVQREKAEGMVEFMLTDLRKRLQGVGKLELLTAVNKRAISYYDGMDLARLPAESLERRAALLHAMGEDDEKRGDLAQATREWQEAHRTTAALLAARPDDAKRVFAHSQSEYWVGFAAWRAGDLRAAKSAFLAYARLTDELRRLEPGNSDYMLEQAYAFSNLGSFTLRPLGQAELAERQFRKSLTGLQAVATARPADQGLLIDISDAFGWLADAKRQQREYVDARHLASLEEAQLVILLRKDPLNIEVRSRRVANAIGRARIEQESGNVDAALKIIDDIRGEASALALSDPGNVDARDAARMVTLSDVDVQLVSAKTRKLAELSRATEFCRNYAISGDEVIAWCRYLRAKLVPNEASRLWQALAQDSTLHVGHYSRRRGFDLTLFRSVERSGSSSVQARAMRDAVP